jgi:hypothetical protein
MFTYAPLVLGLSGDVIVSSFNKASGGLPNFGTLAIDSSTDYHNSLVLYNGAAYKDAAAIVLFGGQVNPEFHLISLSAEKALKPNAVVSASEGGLLQGINGRPAIEYVREIGLATSDEDGALPAISLMVDFGDGTQPAARSMLMVTEEGSIICGGEVPVGSKLSFRVIDSEDIIGTAVQIIAEGLDDSEKGAMIMFSCTGRNLALGTNIFEEFKEIDTKIDGLKPYSICYSGGEICPVPDASGALINRFHNYTLIICSL